jgi:hypothetical protein
MDRERKRAIDDIKIGREKDNWVVDGMMDR